MWNSSKNLSNKVIQIEGLTYNSCLVGGKWLNLNKKLFHFQQSLQLSFLFFLPAISVSQLEVPFPILKWNNNDNATHLKAKELRDLL